MRLSEIKFVVKSLIDKMTCAFCQKKINESQVNILQIIKNKCTLQVHCSDCKKQTILNADVRKRSFPIAQKKNQKTVQKQAFTSESLVEFSNKLQDLNGNLKDFL